MSKNKNSNDFLSLGVLKSISVFITYDTDLEFSFLLKDCVNISVVFLNCSRSNLT